MHSESAEAWARYQYFGCWPELRLTLKNCFQPGVNQPLQADTLLLELQSWHPLVPIAH